MTRLTPRCSSSAAAAVCAAALAASTLPAHAAGAVDTPIQAGGNFSVPTVSMKDIRYRQTIRQQYDFSCGSAAIATLLTHHYGVPVKEEDAFKEMFLRGDQQKIRRDGFSLLDMKNYLESHGFLADGYEARLDALKEAKIPAIVLINERGYGHFVVVKGIREDRVLLGDPSTGVRAMPRADFDRVWKSRILFVIKNRVDRARFDLDTDWALAPRAPIDVAFQQRGLDAIALPKRGPGEF